MTVLCLSKVTLFVAAFGFLLPYGSFAQFFVHKGATQPINVTSCDECNDIANAKCNDFGLCKCYDYFEYIPEKGRCERCPATLGQTCRSCCDNEKYPMLECRESQCQICTITPSGETCSLNLMQNQHLLITVTQIAMTGAMMLGIITILTLFWKLCSKTNLRRRGEREYETDHQGRPTTSSINSLQNEIIERLRDAPPPYRSRLPAPSDNPPSYTSISGNGSYVNNSFIGDEQPPDYNSIINQNPNSDDKDNSEEQKAENQDPAPAIYI